MFPMFSLFSFLVGRWSFSPTIFKGADEKAPAKRLETREWKSLASDLKRLEGNSKAELTGTQKISCKDPQAADYLNGLANRAELLYGKDDPAFVQEYRDYLELNAGSLGAGDQASDLASLQGQIRSPEDYRAKGFLNLPKRPENALGGSQFMEKVLGVDLKEFEKNPRQLGKLSKIERENAILEQIELGNVPEFLRRPKAVTIKGPDGGEVKTYVMPDYIAIGSNEDFVRVPLSPILAQALARKYDWCLPTKTIVEETYAQAGKRVVGPSYSHPEEFQANSAYLDSAGFYLRSDLDIKAQLKGVALGTLVAGGKKELVVSPQVAVRYAGGKAGEAIDFYGLYGADEIPIQRTPGHGREAGYRHTEYALGVRFVSPVLVVTKKSGEKVVMRMDKALQDPEIAKIFSRVERTEDQKKFRSPALDGPFDPTTAYRQGPVKGQAMPKDASST
ncbi:MAG TPA: hypothetical protein VJR29_08800 [bacterium]|nr:hypothetical protein [bacterium]